MSGQHKQWRAPRRRVAKAATGRPASAASLTTAERAARDTALDRLLGVQDWPNRHAGGGA